MKRRREDIFREDAEKQLFSKIIAIQQIHFGLDFS
jgi:hypothetical protein